MSSALKYKKEKLISELTFETSRSSGKGGQHVNKTESKVDLIFDVTQSKVLSYNERKRVESVLSSRIHSGVLRLSCQENRSQYRNKEIVIDRFIKLLQNALIVQKKRVPTKLSYSKKKSRMKDKIKHADKKNARKKINRSEY